MSNRFKSAIIDDITSHNIEADMQEKLLDLFESTIKSLATTLAREAKFDTTDFATAEVCGCEGFKLLVSCIHTKSRDGWLGEFQRGDKCLIVIGRLE